jgi:hypothetical protein
MRGFDPCSIPVCISGHGQFIVLYTSVLCCVGRGDIGLRTVLFNMLSSAWMHTWNQRHFESNHIEIHCLNLLIVCFLLGPLLCFVHADSQPPEELIPVIRKTLACRRTVLGGFRTLIKDRGRPLRFMTAHHLLKTYYLPALTRPLSLLR